jgi:hypothetical protein
LHVLFVVDTDLNAEIEVIGHLRSPQRFDKRADIVHAPDIKHGVCYREETVLPP